MTATARCAFSPGQIARVDRDREPSPLKRVLVYILAVTVHCAGDRWVGIFYQLEADHQKQRGLLERILDASLEVQERFSLFEELCEELNAHAAAEEQTLYVELLAHAQQQIEQGVADNNETAETLFRLYDLDIASQEWLTTFGALKEKVERHLEREEALLLPLARTQIAPRRSKQLGERFENLKQREQALWGRPARGEELIAKRQRLRSFTGSLTSRSRRKRAVSEADSAS